MAILQPSTDFTGSSVDQAHCKTFIATMRTFIADLLGTDSGDKAAARAALGAAASGNVAPDIHAATIKATPVNADEFGFWDSVSGLLRRLTWANIKDALAAIGILQNSQSTGYTCVLSDAQKHLLHPSADTTARTFTIPANASVDYPIGTALTFVNQASAGVLTIDITTDTMRLAGAGTTGSRTLAANGIATALKITSTEWIISGTGLT